MADLGSFLGGVGIGGAIGKAIVQLELETTKYQAELRAAQAQTQTGATGMSNAMAAFGGAAKAGLAVGAVAVGAFAVNAVKAASDLGEAVNKNDVIFGKNAAAVQKWAEGGATAFGLSQTAALDAAAGFGAMLQTAGLAVDRSADMSKALVQLAGDMASFNNIDPTEALEKLRSGLAGEAEPLRRFGVFLSEAAVQAKAMELGLGGATGELTEAEKVQARYAIILEQTNKQQGDFARTADSLPNQIRSMNAEFENVSAEVGTALLPAATALLGVLRDLVPVITFVAEALAKLVENAEALAGPFGVAITLMAQGVKPTEDMNRLLAEQVIEFQRYKEATDEGSKGIQRYTTQVKEAAKETDLFADMTREEFEEWGKETRETFRTAVFQLEDLSDGAKVTRSDVVRAFREMREDAREFKNAMENLPKGKWVNDEFIQFISEQGPDWLIGFAALNKEQQQEMQRLWKQSGEDYNKGIKDSFLDLNGRLNDLDKKTTQHTVKVKYEYVGFDPSKPGMGSTTSSLAGVRERP